VQGALFILEALNLGGYPGRAQKKSYPNQGNDKAPSPAHRHLVSVLRLIRLFGPGTKITSQL
jgi:hypothetical protein